MINLHIGADHGGYALKEALKSVLNDYSIDDYSKEYIDGDDYPDIAEQVGRAVDRDGGLGVLICRSGIGMCIAANKIKGARAATCRSAHDAIMARRDNDANIVCIGADVTKPKEALDIINAFVKEEFLGNQTGGERHLRRVNKIEMMEKRNY